MAVPALLQLVLMVCGMAIQLTHGYTHLEIGLYLHDLFGIQLIELWFLCALAFTVHAVVNHKYLSHFLLALFYIALIASSAMGFEDNLYRFGETADITYSDMNGFGHTLVALRAFEWYWGAFSLAAAGGWATCSCVRAARRSRGASGWTDARRRITPADQRVSFAGRAAVLCRHGRLDLLQHPYPERVPDCLIKQGCSRPSTKPPTGLPWWTCRSPRLRAYRSAIEIDPVQSAHSRHMVATCSRTAPVSRSVS